MINIEPLLLKIKNRRPVVIAAPIVAGIFLGGLLVVKPGLSHLNAVKDEVAGLQEKMSAYQFILDSEKKTTVYKTHFSGDKTWLIEQLNSIAEKTGFSILSILPEDAKKVGDYLDRVSVHIDAESDYHQLGEFVSRVESLDPYVKVLGLDINAEGGRAASTSMAGSPQSGAVGRSGRPITDIYKISMSVGLFTPAAGAL